jgi:hypothetical protein
MSCDRTTNMWVYSYAGQLYLLRCAWHSNSALTVLVIDYYYQWRIAEYRNIWIMIRDSTYIFAFVSSNWIFCCMPILINFDIDGLLYKLRVLLHPFSYWVRCPKSNQGIIRHHPARHGLIRDSRCGFKVVSSNWIFCCLDIIFEFGIDSLLYRLLLHPVATCRFAPSPTSVKPPSS